MLPSRYIYTFIIWPVGREYPQERILNHLNSRHANIHFTKEVQNDDMMTNSIS